MMVLCNKPSERVKVWYPGAHARTTTRILQYQRLVSLIQVRSSVRDEHNDLILLQQMFGR